MLMSFCSWQEGISFFPTLGTFLCRLACFRVVCLALGSFGLLSQNKDIPQILPNLFPRKIKMDSGNEKREGDC